MLVRNENIIKEKMKQYLLPGVMLTAALQIGNIVDTMLVGKLLGSDAMSAVKIGMAVDNIVEIPGYVLGVGGSVAAGIYIGNQEIDKAKRIFSSTLFITVLFGLFFALLSFGSGTYAEWLCGGSSLVHDAERFIFVTLLIAPVFAIALPIINFLAVDNCPSLASSYVITANVINLTMDYVLLKYTSLGTAGAALSTGLGYGLALLLVIFYIKSKKRMLSLVNPVIELKSSIMSAIKAGIPTLLYMIFLTIKDILLNSMILKLIGEAAMVIYTVCFNAGLCVQLIAGGIVGLLSNMGSVLYGKKDFFGIKRLIAYLSSYSYIVLGVFMVLMLGKPGMFLDLFGVTEPEIVSPAILALRIFSFSLPFYLWNHFMMTYYQSTDKTVLSSLITSLQTCVALVPTAYIIIKESGNLGISPINAMALAFILNEIITLFVTYLFQKTKYKDQNYFMLPEQDANTLEFTVRNKKEEMDEALDTIIEFCEHKNISKDITNRLNHVLDEILYNIFTFGHAANTDVCVNLTGDLIYMRLTDNGKPSNPLEYEEAQADDQIFGIKIIKQYSKKIEYLRVIDLNFTVVEINTDSILKDI